jgi:hypothetical protein
MTGATNEVLPVWEETVQTSYIDVATSTRKTLGDTHIPRLGTTLRQPDQRAIAQMATQQGWFLRDEFGVRSDALTKRGQQIVTEGLANGLGREEIGADLRVQLPGMWDAMGKQYANVVAAVGVSRARSFSEVASYQEAGITGMEIVAMLDERTTDICRSMDGLIVPVAQARALIDAGAQVRNPEDIKTVNPFLRQRGGEIATATGTPFAEVARSGRGRVDDRGVANYSLNGSNMSSAGLGAPPYHFNCRTMTVPYLKGGMPATPARTAGPPPGTVPPPGPLPKKFRMPFDRPAEPFRGRAGEATGGAANGGTSPPIDRLVLPDEFVKSPTSFGWLVARDKGASMRFYSQSAENPGEWKSSTAWREAKTLATPGERAEIPHLQKLPPGDVVLDTVRRDGGWGNEDYLNLASMQGMEGRAALMRLRQSSDRKLEHYLRVEPGAPTTRIRATLDKARAQANPTVKQQMIDDLVAEGKAAGWIKTGKLAEVSKEQADRVAINPGKVKPPKPPKPPKPVIVAPPPKPPAKIPPAPPPPGPAPTKPPKPTPALGDSTEYYQVRPPTALAREINTGTDGTWGYRDAAGKWKKIDAKYNTVNYNDLELKPSQRKVEILARRVGATANTDTDLIAADIARHEMSLNQGVVREYTLADPKGAHLFIRVDARKLAAAPPDVQDDLNKLGGFYATGPQREQILARLRPHGLTVTRDIREFNPNVVVDYSKPGLLPGVPVKEQALKRVDAVRAELAEVAERAMREAGYKPGVNVPDDYFDISVGEAVRKHLGKTRGPRTEASKQATLTEVNKGFSGKVVAADDVYTHAPSGRVATRTASDSYLDDYSWFASPALANAMSVRPAPVYIIRGSGMQRAYQQDLGGPHDGGIIVINPHTPVRTRNHETQHWVDGIGYNGAAAMYVRNRNAVDGKLICIAKPTKKNPYGEWALPGKWENEYDARDYGFGVQGKHRNVKRTADEWRQIADAHMDEHLDTHSANEYASQGVQRLITTDASMSVKELGAMFRRNPDQVAVVIAQQRGHFVPVHEN